MSDAIDTIHSKQEDPVAGPIWIVGILGTILLIVTVLGLIALSNDAQQAAVDKEIINPEPDEFQTLMETQQERLATAHYDLFDDETALVIPIDQAMDLVVQEYGEGGR